MKEYKVVLDLRKVLSIKAKSKKQAEIMAKDIYTTSLITYAEVIAVNEVK